jgi:hypothetical protein
MKKADCDGCPYVVWVGKNIKCGYLVEAEWIHLVLVCPKALDTVDVFLLQAKK